MTGHREIRLAFAALATAALIWGYNWVVMKIALRYSGPVDFAALRNGFGALTLFIIIALRRESLRPPVSAFSKTLLLGLLQTTGFVGLIAWALMEGGAGKSAVLAYTMPFWAIVFGMIFLGERIRGLQWLAVALAASGVVLMISPWRDIPDLTTSIISLCAGLVWGASMIVAKKIPYDGRGALLSVTAWQMLLGTLPLIALSPFITQIPTDWNTGFVIALAYNAIMGSALAWLLWLFALKHLPAGMAGIASLGAPAVGVLTAWLQLGETPSFIEALGMCLIFSALAVLSLRALFNNQKGIKP